MSLLVVVTVAVFALGVMQISAVFTKHQMLASHDMRAFYLAEAALAESYLALTDGSTGRIGSSERPARLATGLVWVDATPLGAGLTRLEGTAMTGPGRSTLAITVERVEESIGLFSSEDVVVRGWILVDGYDSNDGTYEEQATELTGSLERMDLQTFAEDWMGVSDPEEVAIGVVFEVQSEELDPGKPKGNGKPSEGAVPAALRQYVYRDMDYAYFQQVSLLPDGSIASGLKGTELVSVNGGDPADFALVEDGPGATTARDGKFGSNGSVRFEGISSYMFGDIAPGPTGTVSTTAGVAITGLMHPRSRVVEFDPVEVPGIPLEKGVDHSGALPLVIAASEVGYEHLHITGGSEVVVRGPATVVLGELTVADGCLLRIDNVDAPVNLIVVGAVDLQVGSTLEVESLRPSDFALQVANDVAVDLLATATFRGTVYAPEAQVVIESEFELFGAVIARRLSLGDGVRLHFDRAVQGDSGPVQLPILVSWEILEIPPVARARLSDPAQQLGVDLGELLPVKGAHESASWTVEVRYQHYAKGTVDFEGPYEDFIYEEVESMTYFRMKAPDVTFLDTWKVTMRYKPFGGGMRSYDGPLSGAPTDEVWFLMERTITPPQELLDQGYSPIVYQW